MPTPRRTFLLRGAALASGTYHLPAPRQAPRGSGASPTPVRGGAQLASALARARPGDTILLASGTYIGDFVASRGGTSEAPVTIAAASPFGATFAGGSIRVAAPDVCLRGLLLNETWVELSADGARMTRCRQVGTTKIAVLVSGGAGIEVDRNELAGMRGRGISVMADARKPWIHHNYVHDFVGIPNSNTHEAVQLGREAPDTDVSLGGLLEHNLFVNVSIDPEVISVKSSDNVVRFNTLYRCAGGLENRHGQRNGIIANWVEGSLGIRVHDRANRVIGNRLIASERGLHVMAGDVTPEAWPATGTHPAAEDAHLAGNDADKTAIGYAYPGNKIPAVGSRIEAHKGPIIYGLQRGATTSSTTTIPIPVARRLTPTEVGPNAP